LVAKLGLEGRGPSWESANFDMLALQVHPKRTSSIMRSLRIENRTEAFKKALQQDGIEIAMVTQKLEVVVSVPLLVKGVRTFLSKSAAANGAGKTDIGIDLVGESNTVSVYAGFLDLAVIYCAHSNDMIAKVKGISMPALLKARYSREYKV
jgi:hypothetical protein